MFYIWHGLAIVLLSASSFGIGYTVASLRAVRHDQETNG